MFGVSRERIRQLAGRYDVEWPEAKGLFAVREWDDEANRFRPVSRSVHKHRKVARRIALRRYVSERYHQHVIDRLALVPTDRPVLLSEIGFIVWGVQLSGAEANSRVVGYVGGQAAWTRLRRKMGIRTLGRGAGGRPANPAIAERDRLVAEALDAGESAKSVAARFGREGNPAYAYSCRARHRRRLRQEVLAL